MNLFDALAANRASVEQALPAARQQLAELRQQCADLEQAIKVAGVLLGRPEPDLAPSVQLPMHESMAQLLLNRPGGMRAPEIVRMLDENGLYRQKNGKPAGVGQVHARVTNYPKLFIRDNGRIRLRRPNE